MESNCGLPVPWSLILEGEELLKDLSQCLKSLAIHSKPWSFHTLAKKVGKATIKDWKGDSSEQLRCGHSLK